MPKLPDFETDEELAAWVDTPDTAEFMDEMEDADEMFAVKRTHFTTKPLDVRLRTDLFVAIQYWTPPNDGGFPIRCLSRPGCARK